MKILIIGSKGFIGSACYAYFRSLYPKYTYGADVVVDYEDPNYFLINPSNSDFKLLFRSMQFDWCINCSGAASVPDSYLHTTRDFILNVNNVVQILMAIKEANVNCSFLQLSSAAVYGNPVVLPITETTKALPLSPYGLHKKQAEEICAAYSNYFGLKTYVLRIFSAYGTGLKKQLFWDLYKKSTLSSHITLFGTGNETRDFIHITDLVKAIEVIIKNVIESHLIINIGNGYQVKIKDAAQTLLHSLDFKGTLDFNGINRDGDPLFWEADVSILCGLGYQQSITFEEGINQYSKWLREKK